MKTLVTVLCLSIILGASCVSLRKKAHSLKDIYESGYHKLSASNTAQDVSVGADGTMYIIGTVYGGDGGNQIRKWNQATQNFDPSIGEGVRVAVNPQGLPWITNALKDVYAYNGATWSRIGVRSVDIGASANGYMTVVNSDEHSLWRNVDGPFEVWCPLWGQTAGSVALDPQGNPWITGDTDNVVYRWDGSQWVAVPGAKGTDIGIGADGTVWIVTDKPASSGGNQVAIFIASSAPTVGAVRISVYPNGDLAGVDNQGTVFRLSNPILKTN
jgi:hypothetical protein